MALAHLVIFVIVTSFNNKMKMTMHFTDVGLKDLNEVVDGAGYQPLELKPSLQSTHNA
jgi:hypothetical protein